MYGRESGGSSPTKAPIGRWKTRLQNATLAGSFEGFNREEINRKEGIGGAACRCGSLSPASIGYDAVGSFGAAAPLLRMIEVAEISLVYTGIVFRSASS